MDRKLEKDRIDEIIGANIRLERISRRLSREELGNMVGVTTSHIGLIEKGQRGANCVTLMRLTKAFGIPIDYLFSSPQEDGGSIRDGACSSLQSKRDKALSLITCLREEEIVFVLQMVKAVISMHNANKLKK
ncbi:MAG: helix-turn-helix domain-containing protein [Defluviitaleaceae bacterium]|nr:helix-turn-helix domain-containing protein [Defluviitaleaceae bacterium]